MSDERAEELGKVRAGAREAAEALEARAAEALELTKKIENLTGGAPGWYAGMRTKVEAMEALRQARVLLDALEEPDRRVRLRE